MTGGYGGLGYETVKALLLKNATVYILGRSADKGKDAIERLGRETAGKGKVEFVSCDLNDLDSIKRCVDQLKEKTAHVGPSARPLLVPAISR